MRKTVLMLFFAALIVSSLVSISPASSSAGENENSWAQKMPMPTPRDGFGVATVNGKIFAIGGDALGTNEMYNPVRDVWTAKAPMPTPRRYFAIAVLQNKIYCMSGIAYGNYSVTIEVYDPETDTWEVAGAMPTARWRTQANVVDGKIYVMGGEPNRTLNEVYDPVADNWTVKASIPSMEVGNYHAAGDYSASAVVEDKICWIGVTGFFDGFRLLTQVYSPENDSWSLRAPPPYGTLPGAAGVTSGVWAPKRIYVISDDRSNRVYDPASNKWTGGNSVPSSSDDFGVVFINDKLYLIGSSTIFHFDRPPSLSKNTASLMYTPFGYGTIPPLVSVLSPKNNVTYSANRASLIFTVNQESNWLGYSLDGQETVTITGNTTIAGLTSGLHNITVYAKDAFENTGTSETITFSIAKETETFPTTWVAAAAATIAIGSVSLAAYHTKRKNKKQKTQT